MRAGHAGVGECRDFQRKGRRSARDNPRWADKLLHQGSCRGPGRAVRLLGAVRWRLPARVA
jgi:hypothetical protein